MDNIVKFDKPYKFEGKEYDSLDLSGMEKMTVQDLIDIQKNIGNELAAMSVMEMTTSFAQEMAVKATGKPVEFCCAIGDETVGGIPYEEIVETARADIKSVGGFEAFAEWGLV